MKINFFPEVKLPFSIIPFLCKIHISSQVSDPAVKIKLPKKYFNYLQNPILEKDFRNDPILPLVTCNKFSHTSLIEMFITFLLPFASSLVGEADKSIVGID